MIPLRTHVAALIAVFLALAIGIALGGGLLGGDGDGDNNGSSGSAATASPSAGSDDALRAAAFAERFATAGAARLYANGLAGHAVAILTLPGVDQSTVKALDAQVVLAGGAITGTFTLGSAALDPDQRAALDTFGSATVTQLNDPRLDPGADTYERLGQLIGLALATTQVSSIRADPAAVTLRQSLATAKLLTSPVDVRLAPLVLVVLPPGAGGSSADTASLRTALSGLVNGLSTVSAGVVAAGDAASAQGGEVEALRSAELVGPISTVDGVETPLGQVTTILALESVLGGTGGSYGMSGKDGPVPVA